MAKYPFWTGMRASRLRLQFPSGTSNVTRNGPRIIWLDLANVEVADDIGRCTYSPFEVSGEYVLDWQKREVFKKGQANLTIWVAGIFTSSFLVAMKTRLAYEPKVVCLTYLKLPPLSLENETSRTGRTSRREKEDGILQAQAEAYLCWLVGGATLLSYRCASEVPPSTSLSRVTTFWPHWIRG